MRIDIDYRFKFLYTIGIISVVVGHSGVGISLLYEWFTPYSFHLPLFMFASGYLYKMNSVEHVWTYIKKKIYHLIIPLYLWNVFYGILVNFLSNYGFTIGGKLTLQNIFLMPLVSNHQFKLNSGQWFVVPLFCIQLFNVLIRYILRKVRLDLDEIMLCVGGGIGILGVCLIRLGYGNIADWKLFLVRFMCYLPFFELGILYKNRLERKVDKIPNLIYFSSIFFLQLCVTTYYGKQLVFGFGSRASEFNENIFMFYLVGVLGIFFWLRISGIVVPITSKSKIINMIADNTSAIMIHQYLGFLIVKSCFALVSKYTVWFSDFNVYEYKNNLFYYYLVRGNAQWYLIYLVAGLCVPIFIQLCIEKIKSEICSWYIFVKQKCYSNNKP